MNTEETPRSQATLGSATTTPSGQAHAYPRPQGTERKPGLTVGAAIGIGVVILAAIALVLVLAL